MNDLRKARIAAKAWVTKSGKDLVTLCSSARKQDINKVFSQLEDFKKKVNKLDAVQDDYELSLDTEEEITEDIKRTASFKLQNVWPVFNAAES